jgi:uridine monophosphate synthetase
MMGMIDRESLVTSLYDLGAIQFGEFRLKSGEKSPIYLDLRLLISRPASLRRVANTLQSFAATLPFDRLAGIPMAGLPIAVALSLAMDRPLIYARPETKQHGTGREIEGEHKAGETVLLIDDVISGGHSKAESIAVLEAAGLKVRDVLVVVDREMGGVQVMAARGYTVHSALKVTDILDMLLRLRRIKKKQQQEVMAWLEKRKS